MYNIHVRKHLHSSSQYSDHYNNLNTAVTILSATNYSLHIYFQLWVFVLWQKDSSESMIQLWVSSNGFSYCRYSRLPSQEAWHTVLFFQVFPAHCIRSDVRGIWSLVQRPWLIVNVGKFSASHPLSTNWNEVHLCPKALPIVSYFLLESETFDTIFATLYSLYFYQVFPFIISLETEESITLVHRLRKYVRVHNIYLGI